MKIRHSTKKLFMDMSVCERKDCLKIAERAVAIWKDKVMEVFNGNVLEELQMGNSINSKSVCNGLVGLKSALSYYSANCLILLEWKELMKGGNTQRKAKGK